MAPKLRGGSGIDFIDISLNELTLDSGSFGTVYMMFIEA